VEYGPTGGIISTSMTSVFLVFCTAEDADVSSMVAFLLLSGAGDSFLPSSSVADGGVDSVVVSLFAKVAGVGWGPMYGIDPAIPLSGESYVSCGLLSKSLVCGAALRLTSMSYAIIIIL
jgi:hypothetical protein